jgi:hypothetical protein
MAPMSASPPPSAALVHVSRIAASLPSLPPAEIDELADAVESLTEAIGLQRDWASEDRQGDLERASDSAPLSLAGLDMSRAEEPRDAGDERAGLEAWLAYQRHEFQRKLRDLSAAQLADWSVPPVELSVLGLVRHMRQMESGYLGWGLTGDGVRDHYGEDDYPGGDVDTVDADIRGWLAEVERSDAAIASLPSLDDRGSGHGRSLRWTLLKMIHEYTLHAGQAHMLRFAALGDVRR